MQAGWGRHFGDDVALTFGRAGERASEGIGGYFLSCHCFLTILWLELEESLSSPEAGFRQLFIITQPSCLNNPQESGPLA